MISWLKKTARFLYVLYAFLVFFLLMLGVAFCVLVFIFFPKPYSGNYIYKTCSGWATCWFFLVGIRHRILYEKGYDLSRPCIIVANHQSYMDIPVTVHSLAIPYRILGKSEMSKIPIFGFIYKKAVIMVDRSSKMARVHSYMELKKALAMGLSVLVYPEGTFNTTGKPLKDFYDGAFKLALSMQVPIQPMLLLDTLKRMHYSSPFSLCPGLCRTVFLPQIHTAGYREKEHARLKANVFREMETAILRYNQQ